MSVSRVLNRWLNRLYKSIAVLLVIFAVLMSGLRLFLPYAHNYKIAFENYINETYQHNIAIGTMNMGWNKFGPTLVAKNVSFLETKTANVHVDNIDIRINFWATLLEQKLVSHQLALDGLAIFIDQNALSASTGNDQALLDNTIDLFFTQIRRFSLSNSEVVLKNADLERKFIINHLNWLNVGDRHRASGDVKIAGVSSNNLKLLLDLTGAEREEMSGELYLQANQLNITPWLDKVFVIDDEHTNSDVNFEAWLSIENGFNKKLSVQLGNNEISWQNQAVKKNVVLNQGQLVFEKTASNDGFTLLSTPLNVVINDIAWQPLRIELIKNSQNISGNISSIDLAGTSSISTLLIEDPKTSQLIKELSPVGTVDDIFFDYRNDKLNLSANFNQVSTAFSDGIPGIQNLSGDVIFSGDTLKANISAKDGTLDFDKHFFFPIKYSELSAQLITQFSSDGVVINVSNVQHTSEELSLSADVQVTIPNEGLAEMALLASVKDGDAKFASNYYPHLLMGQNLVDYLNRGIVEGQIEQANVLFNGPLSKFPFNDHSGIFVVDAELTNSLFLFDENWPAIENFNANLNFTNNSMLITGRSGSLTGLDVTGVEAAIAELKGSKILTVDVNINKAEPQHITDLMMQSPLHGSVGATLQQVVIGKPISGEFNLALPLEHTENVIAKGKIVFSDNDISLQKPAMEFSQANGQLSFVNEIISVDRIAINWLGLPLNLSVDANQQQDYYQTDINIDANWQDAQWQQQVPELLKKYNNGLLQWQGLLSLRNHRDGGFSYRANITSDLEQLAINIPAPYSKALGDKIPFNVEVKGRFKQSTINASVGDQLSFYGELNHQDVYFTRSHLVLGDDKMLLPMDGFHITTNLEHANLSQWQPFISDILDSIEENNPDEFDHRTRQTHMFPVPERIRGTIGELDVLGLPLSHVSFNFLDKSSWWLLQLNAKETRSQIKFFPNWLEQGVDVDADFIHIPKKAPVEIVQEDKIAQEDEIALQEASIDEENIQHPSIQEEITLTEKSPIDELNISTQKEEDIVNVIPDSVTSLYNNDLVFSKFPPINFKCDSCRISSIDLGAVEFLLAREDDKLLVKQFRARRDKSELKFDLSWQHNEKISNTTVTGSISLNDLERELEKFDYDSIIKESGLTANFNASWQGGPYDFTSDGVDGNISASIDDGYLAEVGDTAKIFSILSLQSLVRKLTLDFRDIFSDGMFYSAIDGDFQIENGVFYTDNVKMDGAAGDLVMKGNTNITDGTLDYTLSYKPNLTSSLPVLAWIATLQPTIFLAGIAIDQVFTSQVVSEFNFELTGSVEEPDFKEVDRKTMDISVGQSTPPQVVEQSEQVVPQEQMQKQQLEPEPDEGGTDG